MRRGDKDGAERVDPTAVRLARSYITVTELVEPIETGQLDLELQGRVTVAPRQRHQQPGGEAFTPSGLHLLADEIDRLLAIDWQHVIGKPSKIHWFLPIQAFLVSDTSAANAGRKASISPGLRSILFTSPAWSSSASTISRAYSSSITEAPSTTVSNSL
jgi:hypothetical protein